jgi:hypothetical protein
MSGPPPKIMNAALGSRQDSLDDQTALTIDPEAPDPESPTPTPPATPVRVNLQSATGAPSTPAPDALAKENQPPLAGVDTLAVYSAEPDSSQSIGTALVPDAEVAARTAALFSMQDRRRRLTSLLHHLTVDPGTSAQTLPMAAPAPWAGERRARAGSQFSWLFVLAGVTGALVGWGTILLLPSLVHAGLPQRDTELAVAANVQSAAEAPPRVRNSLPQGGTELAVAANVQSTIEAPPRVHDSLPKENTEPPVAANVQFTTEAPPLVHAIRRGAHPDRLRSVTSSPPPIAFPDPVQRTRCKNDIGCRIASSMSFWNSMISVRMPSRVSHHRSGSKLE